MAQEASFLSNDYYAVGRWDGTLSIFQFTDSSDKGPIVAKAVNSPAQEGVQMITPLANFKSAFVSSNDESSMVVWASQNGDWSDLTSVATLAYADAYGVANRGVTVSINSYTYLVVGHANGYVSIWRSGAVVTDWKFVTATDVRSSTPVNPWGLHNIRGIVQFGALGIVITGSEDGNLTVLEIPSGRILSATVFNPRAQRGINNIAIERDVLLVVNCSVGKDDYNLWSYKVNSTTWEITSVDKSYLKIDPDAIQVFNFDVLVGLPQIDKTAFFSSTEEGVLWFGTVDRNGGITTSGNDIIGDGDLGSALCMSDTRLAVTSYNLHQYGYNP